MTAPQLGDGRCLPAKAPPVKLCCAWLGCCASFIAVAATLGAATIAQMEHRLFMLNRSDAREI